VVASEPAVELIAQRGGRLYVWPRQARCCGGATRLVSATTPPSGKRFGRSAAAAEFELYLPHGLSRLPDELHIELRRYPRRLESYWDGCAWVI